MTQDALPLVVSFAVVLLVWQGYLYRSAWKMRHPRLEEIAVAPISPQPVKFAWSRGGILFEACWPLPIFALPFLDLGADFTAWGRFGLQWALPLVAIICCARGCVLLKKSFAGPALLVSRDGVVYGGEQFRWSEIRSIRMSGGIAGMMGKYISISLQGRSSGHSIWIRMTTYVSLPAWTLADPYAFVAYSNKILEELKKA